MGTGKVAAQTPQPMVTTHGRLLRAAMTRAQFSVLMTVSHDGKHLADNCLWKILISIDTFHQFYIIFVNDKTYMLVVIMSR